MKDASEDEQEEDFIVPSKTDVVVSGPSRAEREQQIRTMMEDEGRFNSSDRARSILTRLDVPMDDAREEDPVEADDSHPIDAPVPPAEGPTETTVVVSGGRRRGRRKVMKKKTIKDEEGFLGQYQGGNCASLSRCFCSITVLMRRSDKGGTSVGVILGRRTSSGSKAKTLFLHGIHSGQT